MAYIKEGASNGSHTYELNIRSRFRAYLSRQLSLGSYPETSLTFMNVFPNLLLPAGFISNIQLSTQTPKARGLTRHGGPPGWLEKSDPAGVILDVMDCLSRTVPVALAGAAQVRADGISSCCYIINVHNRPS